MTPEAQRIAIAEACGYKLGIAKEQSFADPQKEIEHKSWFSPNGCRVRNIPDYLNDLNAMHEAEESIIEPHFINKYADELYMVLERFWTIDRWMKFDRLGIDYAFSHATARQHAEAFLRTIGKWEE